MVARKAARDRTCDAMTAASTEDVIELRVDDIAQLFHTIDPFPFQERDLDREMEEYIVGWARELAADQPITIVIHFPDAEAQTKAARELSEAFDRYFSDRAGVLQRDLARCRDLYRRLSTSAVEPRPYPLAASEAAKTGAG